MANSKNQELIFSWRVFEKTRKDWNLDQLIVILVSSGYVLRQ